MAKYYKKKEPPKDGKNMRMKKINMKSTFLKKPGE